jgi:hypothetical protein
MRIVFACATLQQSIFFCSQFFFDRFQTAEKSRHAGRTREHAGLRREPRGLFPRETDVMKIARRKRAIPVFHGSKLGVGIE